jgi:hypothetical protein
MEVRADRVPRRADVADARAGPDRLAAVDADAGEMRVPRAHAVPVPELDEMAVAAAVPADERDPAGRGREDGRAVGRREIEPGVEGVPPGPEPVTDRSSNRPPDGDRRARSRASEGAIGRRPGDPTGVAVT